jgi:hypothetical protein
MVGRWTEYLRIALFLGNGFVLVAIIDSLVEVVGLIHILMFCYLVQHCEEACLGGIFGRHVWKAWSRGMIEAWSRGTAERHGREP